MSVVVFSSWRRGALAGLALLCSALPAAAQDPARMDQIVRAAADEGEFSGSVLVARGAQVLLDQGYGLANREWEIANDGDTRFRLASVSKQFTAVAALLLSERGRLDLDAPIRTYLPDAPATWDAVTTRLLLTHGSGIPDFTRDADYGALKVRPTTPAELIARVRDRPLAFRPGEGWAYSNSGYVVATAVIEAASGERYADFVQANLFAPLGMADSGYDSHAAIVPHRAAGYVPTREGVVNADYVDMSVPQGAGGLYSTTRDLLKWEEGLFGGRLLKPASLAALTTPYRDDYALGLVVRTEDGDAVVSHSGGIEGFNTYLGRDLDAGLTVVVLGNLNGAAPEKLGRDLMTLARGGTVTLARERRTVTLSAQALEDYVGVYALASGLTLTLSVADGRLTAQATGQPAVELFPEVADAFFLTAVDAQITFDRDAAGAITGLVLHQGGRDMPAARQ